MRSVISEFIGSCFLLMIVVGSGVMGENLSSGNVAIALLANSLATGFGLFVLIQSLGPISGAHFNPVVSFIEMLRGKLSKQKMMIYFLCQFFGAILGIILTHLMFDLEIFQIAQKERVGINLYFSEFIATFGLLSIIQLACKKNDSLAPLTIASYITAAYWFTSSSSFANPAVTFARIFTDTFCAIAPSGVIYFIIAQISGALFSYFLLRD